MSRILIVDDEKGIRVTLGEFLSDAGHEVGLAEDAETATEMLGAGDFDVVVTDIIMPRITGVKLLKVVKEASPHVQVILMTGEPNVETASEAVRAGAFDYLAKPIDIDRLLKVVANAARIKSLDDERRRLAEENRKYREHLEQLVDERTADLRESEERYRTLVTHAPICIHEIDLRGNFISMNQAGLEMLGGDKETEVCGLPYISAVSEPQRPRIAELLAQALEGRTVNFEFDSSPENGRRSFASSFVPIKNDAGRVVRLMGMTRDITERKKAEDILRESKAELGRILSNSPLGIGMVVDRMITFANPALCDLIGYTEAELVGQSVRILYPSEEEFVRVGRTKYPILQDSGLAEIETKFEHKNGTVIDVAMHTAFLEKGNPSEGLVSSVLDLSERNRVQAELVEREARSSAILDTAAEGIITINEAGVVESMNVAAEKIFGYSAAEIVGKNVKALMPEAYSNEHDDHIRRYLKTGIRGIIDSTREVEGLRKSGDTFPLKLSVSEVRFGKRRIFTGIVQDLTVESELREQLVQSQKMEAVGQLAGGIAHDFNNLLTAINGNSALLLRNKDLGKREQRLLGDIYGAGERAAELTGQLLAFSRKQLLKPKPICLNDRVKGVHGLLQRLLREDLIYEAHLDNDLGLAYADPSQIDQVIINLVVNARDAIDGGGRITVETKSVELDATFTETHLGATAGPHVMLSVRDSGTGIDEAIISKIFDPFFSTKEQGKGTGLGLSMIHGIMKQSGGGIWATSEIGKGSTFEVYFPLMPPSDPTAADPLENGIAELERGEETVLLVEDEKMVRDLTFRVLEECGYRVILAATPGEAIKKSNSHGDRISLILSDVVMPEMSGRELCDRLKGTHPKMKILYMSGYTADTVIRHGVETDSVNYLQKPFTPELLAERVRTILDS